MTSSRQQKIHKNAFACLGVALLVLAPTMAFGFRIEGRVVNGTTASPVSPATILVVRPSGGMMVEQEVQTLDDEGHFEVDGLDDQAPVYLLRVAYKGINYTEIVQFRGHDPETVEIEVYETTSSWEEVRVSIPHLIVSRRADTLQVDKFFQITNATQPPKTVSPKEAPFTFHIPEDKLGIAAFQVMSLGVPLPMTPQPTEEPGFYTVDYPMRPGVTQVSMSLILPYGGGTYAYREKFKYDIDELVVMVGDPAVQVSQAGAPLERGEDMHGFATYRLAEIDAADEVVLTFAGGTTTPPQGSMPQIHIVPNETNTLSLVLLIVLGLALIGMVVFVALQPRRAGIDPEVLAAHREALLDELAKLDDLHKTGTLSEKVYADKRNELITALAQIYYRTQFAGESEEKETSDKEGAARV